MKTSLISIRAIILLGTYTLLPHLLSAEDLRLELWQKLSAEWDKKAELSLGGQLWHPQSSFALKALLSGRYPISYPAILEGPAVFGVSALLEHRNSGSHIAYGKLQREGLLARLYNPFLRKTASEDLRPDSGCSLSDTAISTNPAHMGFVVGTPQKHPLRIQALLYLIEENSIGLIMTRWNMGRIRLRLEGGGGLFHVPATSYSGWFHTEQPAPQRELLVYCAHISIKSLTLSIATDMAASYDPFLGNGYFINIGLYNRTDSFTNGLALIAATKQFTSLDARNCGPKLRIEHALELSPKDRIQFKAFTFFETESLSGTNFTISTELNSTFEKIPLNNAKPLNPWLPRLQGIELATKATIENKNPENLNIRTGLDLLIHIIAVELCATLTLEKPFSPECRLEESKLHLQCKFPLGAFSISPSVSCLWPLQDLPRIDSSLAVQVRAGGMYAALSACWDWYREQFSADFTLSLRQSMKKAAH